MVLCSRAVQGIKKDKKRIKEAGPFCRMASGPASFCLKNHLQHLLPGDFAGNTVVLSVHGLREFHRNRIGNLSETCKTERSERPPLPSKFLIFPLPFLIFSGALEHRSPQLLCPGKGAVCLAGASPFRGANREDRPGTFCRGMEKEQPIASTRPPVKRPGRASHRFLLERTSPDAAAPPCSEGTGRRGRCLSLSGRIRASGASFPQCGWRWSHTRQC